jgi:hypothetical protein
VSRPHGRAGRLRQNGAVTPEPARRLTRGWAITLLVVVVVVFIGGSTAAALSFVTSLNARPLTVTCTVVSTFGDAAHVDTDDGRPGYSVQTEGADSCEDFYVRDVAVREQIEVGGEYAFTVENLIGYTNVISVEPVG